MQGYGRAEALAAQSCRAQTLAVAMAVAAAEARRLRASLGGRM